MVPDRTFFGVQRRFAERWAVLASVPLETAYLECTTWYLAPTSAKPCRQRTDGALVGEAVDVLEGEQDVVEGVIGLVLLDDEPLDAG